MYHLSSVPQKVVRLIPCPHLAYYNRGHCHRAFYKNNKPQDSSSPQWFSSRDHRTGLFQPNEHSFWCSSPRTWWCAFCHGPWRSVSAEHTYRFRAQCNGVSGRGYGCDQGTNGSSIIDWGFSAKVPFQLAASFPQSFDIEVIFQSMNVISWTAILNCLAITSKVPEVHGVMECVKEKKHRGVPNLSRHILCLSIQEFRDIPCPTLTSSYTRMIDVAFSF